MSLPGVRFATTRVAHSLRDAHSEAVGGDDIPSDTWHQRDSRIDGVLAKLFCQSIDIDLRGNVEVVSARFDAGSHIGIEQKQAGCVVAGVVVQRRTEGAVVCGAGGPCGKRKTVFKKEKSP